MVVFPRTEKKKKIIKERLEKFSLYWKTNHRVSLTLSYIISLSFFLSFLLLFVLLETLWFCDTSLRANVYFMSSPYCMTLFILLVVCVCECVCVVFKCRVGFISFWFQKFCFSVEIEINQKTKKPLQVNDKRTHLWRPFSPALFPEH